MDRGFVTRSARGGARPIARNVAKARAARTDCSLSCEMQGGTDHRGPRVRRR